MQGAASSALNALPDAASLKATSLFCGLGDNMRLSTLLLPLAITPAGALAAVTSKERVFQGVSLYFGTLRGSRCMVPEFGYPPLSFYAGALPQWTADVERGLELVAHVASARLDVRLDDDGMIRGTAFLQTDAGEEMHYEFAISGA